MLNNQQINEEQVRNAYALVQDCDDTIEAVQVVYEYLVSLNLKADDKTIRNHAVVTVAAYINNSAEPLAELSH